MAKNHKNIITMQLMKFDLFKSQNSETGRFDVVFEMSGKLLYAHRNMLTLISDTFDSMLSERWTPNKDEPIKIKDYSYNDFYQFLTFLYSGQCQLTDENIFSMVDIAEFYGVQIFKNYCDEYLAAMEITLGNIFQLLELVDKYSTVQLKTSAHAFIIDNFQNFAETDGLFNVSKSVMDEMFTSVKDKIKPEDVFQAVYKWSKKRAMVEQTNNPSLNLNDQIKVEITDFLPNICFSEMDLDFLHEFVVPKGFIFSSLSELSKILCDRKSRKKVKITNENGQTLHGNILPDKTVLKNIESLNSSFCHRGFEKYCWWLKMFNHPTTPSPMKKKDGIQWYLIYYLSGRIGVEHCSEINETRYLIVELTAGPNGFDTACGCKIEIQ